MVKKRIEYIDIKTLSEMIAVKPKTIYEWVRKGKLPFYKMEGALRFHPEEINKWMEERHFALRYVIHEDKY